MGQRWSLRARFVLVASACLLPLLGVVLFVLQQSLENSRAQLLDAQTATVDVVAQVLGARFDEYEQVLRELAAQPAVQRLEADAAGEVLGQFRRARSETLYGLFLVSRDRQTVALSGLEPNPLPSDIAPALERALGPPGEFGVSNRITLPGGDEVIAIALPVLAQDRAEGDPIGVVGALLSVEQLRETVLPFARGETVIAIVAEEQVIASRAGDDALDTRAIADRLAGPIAEATAGTIGSVGYEDENGASRLAAYAPVDVPGAGWAVLVSRPAPTTYASNRMLLVRGLVALAAAFVATLLLAIALAEWIARPLRMLTAQARAMTRGDFSRRQTSTAGGEIGALSASFGVMADRFETQVADLETAREENAERAEQLRELHRRTVRLQEDERRRIAAEIHDAVAPLITGALYQARALQLGDSNGHELGDGSKRHEVRQRLVEGLEAVGDLLARAMSEIHDVIFALRPPDLDDLGVVAAIERYVGQIQRSGLNTRLEIVGDPPELTPEVRLAIYRIVQEALHNALRHAAADEAVVRFEVMDGVLRVTIRDNGAGFDPQRTSRPSSLGLLSMRERASAIRAELSVDSRPGDGTRVIIERRLEPESPGDADATEFSRYKDPLELATVSDPQSIGATQG